MLTEKDYCDYKLVLELKELGYDYIRREGLIHLYDAQKWLREKDMIVHVFPVEGYSEGDIDYCYGITWDGHYKESSEQFCDFTEALSEGVRASIKILQDEQKKDN